jgi:hypothetical protein
MINEECRFRNFDFSSYVRHAAMLAMKYPNSRNKSPYLFNREAPSGVRLRLSKVVRPSGGFPCLLGRGMQRRMFVARLWEAVMWSLRANR